MRNFSLLYFFIGIEEEDDICKIFEPLLTSRGVCYSFNSKSHHELYTETPFASMFQEVFRPMRRLNATKNKGLFNCISLIHVWRINSAFKLIPKELEKILD